MKCQSCKIKIDSSFAHAIKMNQCPACGEAIMDHKKLGSYLSLQSLLESKLPDVDSEKVANLIVANFEVRQLFKEEDDTSSPGQGIIEVGDEESEESVVVEEDIDPDVASDNEHKKAQMADAKERLRRMREEALTEATAEHWGLGDANGLVNPAALSVEEKLRWEREQRQQNITSGAGGAFRRGD